MLFWIYVVLIFTRCPFGIESARSLHYQPYITAELAGSIRFRISWYGTQKATSLTLLRINNGTSTNVLDIEGTQFTSKNDWANKTIVEITFDNSTRLFEMTLNLRDVAVEDEGLYRLRVYEGNHVGAETFENTGEFRIQTYARPTNLGISISSTNKKYAEGSEAMFTCTGNAGRPLGRLQLVQSYGHQNGGFRTIATVEPNMILKREGPNGTYNLFYTFQVNLSHLDENSRFKCRLTSGIPKVIVTDSGAIRIPVATSGK